MGDGNISIDDIIKLLQSGGNVALILGIWFGGKVVTATTRAIKTFDAIAENVEHVRTVVDTHFGIKKDG
jgi:hypothetical protein